LVINPQPKQSQFLDSSADIAIFGGSAGGGKTHALLLEPLKNIDLQGFYALFLRRTMPQITNPGGLWDEAREIYSKAGATIREQAHRAVFESGSYISFSQMQHESDKYNYQGAQIPLIIFDQLEQFTESQFWFMMARNRSKCGVMPYIRASANPDPDGWLKKIIQWWLKEDGSPDIEKSGVVRYFVRRSGGIVWGDTLADFEDSEGPKSLTFIFSSIYDNQELLSKNPEYLNNLKNLELHERAALLDGNWNAVQRRGNVFSAPNYCETLGTDGKKVVGYYDPAFTDDSGDYSALTIGYDEGGVFYIVRGEIWRKQWDVSRESIANICRANGVSLLGFEKNGAQIVAAKNLPNDINVRLITNHKNKHVRIQTYAKDNWHKIRFMKSVSDAYMRQILSYSDIDKTHDDAPDSLAGFIELLTSRVQVKELW
jgi:hypothetical protein